VQPHVNVDAPRALNTAGMLLKKVEGRASSAWSPRWLSLCTDCLMICNEPGSQVKDVITLLEIGDIHVWNHVGGFPRIHASLMPPAHTTSLESEKGKRDQAHELHELAKGREKTQILATPTQDHAHLDQLEWENSGRIISLHVCVCISTLLSICERHRASHMCCSNAVCISLPFQRRVFHFKATSAEECAEWVNKLREVRAEALRQYRTSLELSMESKFRLAVMHAYDHRFTQWFLAIILLLNFLVNIVESESARDTNVDMRQTFDHIDLAFTVFYTLELVIHMYGRWFWAFWSDGWCVLDFVIVLLSVIDTIILLVVDSTGRKSRLSLCSSVLLQKFTKH